MCNLCFVVMTEFVVGNERVYGPFMRFAQKVSLKTMPNDAEIDKNIKMFTSHLETFSDYTPVSDKLGPYYKALGVISSFTKQLNEVEIRIKNMRDSAQRPDDRDIAIFKEFLLNLGVFFKEMQRDLGVYFQKAASAKGGGEKSRKEILTDLLQRMMAIVDRLPS